MTQFFERVAACSQRHNSLLCIGLDADPARIPQILKNDPDPVFSFNRELIDATADLVCCYKPQVAYYGAHGNEDTLVRTIEYAQQAGIPVLLDSKRGDIGSTAEKYSQEAFVRFNADAVTVNPYMGHDALQPFLDYKDKGIYVLCRTSNPGGSDLQNLLLENGQPVYEHIAEEAVNHWNQHGNVGLVVGATRPEELARIRKIVGTMSLLLPGVGAQGADVGALMQNGQGGGMLINSSRAIIYAGTEANFAQAARQVAEATRSEINRHR